jgi:hypothetical protein
VLDDRIFKNGFLELKCKEKSVEKSVLVDKDGESDTPVLTQ